MNKHEIHRRVINKLLNQRMKKKYNYEQVFYLNPVQYLLNIELNTDFHLLSEIVSVNLKSPITMCQRDRLIDDLRECLNLLIPLVEGCSKRKINNVILKFKQPIVSGILQHNKL
jgi:hypothetical protein